MLSGIHESVSFFAFFHTLFQRIQQGTLVGLSSRQHLKKVLGPPRAFPYTFPSAKKE